MNEKEELILEEIVNYLEKNKRMPSMRYLQNKFNYKSVNSITYYMKSLEKQNYLTRNNEGKLILNNYSNYYKSGLKTIKIINANNEYANIILNKNEKYIAYKIHHNYFNKLGIYKNDILIIKKKKHLNNNDLGLFIINNKYRVMNYQNKENFYIVYDNEQLILNKVKIVGKVILCEHKL